MLLVVLVGGATAYALTRPGSADAEAPASPEATASAPVPSGDASDDPATPSASPAPPSETPAAPAVCDDPAVAHALTSGDDADVIEAVGGGDAFRAAVVDGGAPCLDLTEAGRMWVVVNKRNALDPIDHWPTPQAQPTGIRVVSGGGWLRADVAAALDELAAEIVEDGAGRLAVDSAFRPYSFQVDLYKGYVASRGQAAADLRSARPGHSEHQTGLAVDVVACGASGCGSHDGFRGTSQAAWLVDNAWRFGFVVRYEEGRTETTGYAWEPWHLRFIGTELAAAYHAGGFHTLEDFFSLPPAPTYAD